LLGYSSSRNPWIFFWLGFFAVSTLSMLCSLFVPINLVSLIAFFIIGAAGLPFFYREYKQSIAQCGEAEIKIFKCAVLLVFLVIVSRSAFILWPPEWAIDTDLYHAQVIRWYNEYGTVPGLGNLHSRLAFNSSWFSLAALFDNGIWDARSPWIMPALALLGGIFYCLHELIFARKNGVRLYALCILAWILYMLRTGAAIPSLYYDNPVHILNGVIVLEAYYLLSGYTRNLSKKEIHEAANLLMLGAGAFMVKPIGAVSLGFSGLLSLFLLIRNTKQSVSQWFKILVPGICAFGIWVIKNIFLSGYLMYPLPVFALPLDWTMPFAAAKGIYNDVLAWARMPGPDYMKSLENGFLFWFKPWLGRNLIWPDFLKLAVFPSFLAVLFWLLVVRYTKIKTALYFFVWTVFSIVYWFLTAPDIRFGSGFFWVCLGAAILFVVPKGPRFELARFWKNPQLRLAFFYLWGVDSVYSLGRTALSPDRNLLAIGSIPARPVKEYTVNANLPFTVWIPADGSEDRTGNSPLPSTPYPPGNLEMREPGNLGKGFRPARR
jgi:hypothetical protein